MRHHPFTKLASILVVCLMAFSSAAFADEAQLMDMVKQMQKQMNDLQSTVMAQKAELEAALGIKVKHEPIPEPFERKDAEPAPETVVPRGPGRPRKSSDADRPASS